MKKVKGLSSTDGQSPNSRGDVKCRVGNTVGHTVITTRGARLALEIVSGTLGQVSTRLSNHYAVHLKQIQNNLEHKL